MLLKVAAVVLVLVIWSGRCGDAAELDGAEVERDGREGEGGWRGGAEEADEVEGGAGVGGDLEGADAGGWWLALGCGVKVTMRMQLAEGRMVAQLLWTVKSGVVWRLVMWMGTVPVLARVMVWGCAALPTCVVAKVRELCEAV